MDFRGTAVELEMHMRSQVQERHLKGCAEAFEKFNALAVYTPILRPKFQVGVNKEQPAALMVLPKRVREGGQIYLRVWKDLYLTRIQMPMPSIRQSEISTTKRSFQALRKGTMVVDDTNFEVLCLYHGAPSASGCCRRRHLP
jgi:hypothetical protein